MPATTGNVDHGLLSRLSSLLLCSACLRRGVRTPVPQVISRRHRPRSLCAACGPGAAASAPRPPARLQ